MPSKTPRKQSPSPHPKHSAPDKVGSNPDTAHHVLDNPKDFGIPVRTSVHRATEDDGIQNRPAADFEANTGNEATRESGVGTQGNARGEGSGGDLDTEIIGFGAGGAIADSPPNPAPKPRLTDGSKNPLASGPPAKGEHPFKASTLATGDIALVPEGDARTQRQSAGNPADSDSTASGPNPDPESGADPSSST